MDTLLDFSLERQAHLVDCQIFCSSEKNKTVKKDRNSVSRTRRR